MGCPGQCHRIAEHPIGNLDQGGPGKFVGPRVQHGQGQTVGDRGVCGPPQCCAAMLRSVGSDDDAAIDSIGFFGHDFVPVIRVPVIRVPVIRVLVIRSRLSIHQHTMQTPDTLRCQRYVTSHRRFQSDPVGVG